ncbi:hypothetical protein BACCIP111899_01580 [Bacillus rhizoplanae]|uniref:GIY-YIG domain-containing protein n=1 Tax=Bacillus rhizoplanae TaxID=2880966 RepID=A0ABN7ZTW2_9BACI|nr:hypothetical protein [Bacillus rhizoplanae]CAG9612404.1 hypothetical protein BACCIP111899_01580 [Bacillus rhizoplanae]
MRVYNEITLKDIQNGNYKKILLNGMRGLYLIYNSKDQIVYVGEGHLQSCCTRHFIIDDAGISHHYNYFRYILEQVHTRKRLERDFIEALKPIFNIRYNVRNLISMGFEYPPKYMPEYSTKAQRMVEQGKDWRKGLPLRLIKHP